MTPYQKYQLQWMIDHDKSLDDLIHELHEYEQECEEKEPLPSLYHLWIQDSGFNGELFVSESEYKDYEGANTEDEEIQNAFKEFLLKEYPSTIIDYYWDQNEQLSSDDLEKILELAQTYKMTFIDSANEYLLSANEPFQTYEYESEIIDENIRKFYDTHLEFPRENAEDLMLDSIFYNTISFNCNIEQLLRNSYPSDLTLYFESDGDIHDNFVSQVSDDYTTKEVHTNYRFNEGYPWYSEHDDTINNIILEEDDPNMDITGVYLTHLNGDHDIDGLTNHRTLQFSEEPVHLYCWGVSDNATQAKKYIDECIEAYQQGLDYEGDGDFFQGKQLVQFMQAIEEENREYGFVLLLTPIVNEHNHEWGGWRWHKWGEYLGHHQIEHEYLNDEDGVDFVFVWKLVAVVKDEGMN